MSWWGKPEREPERKCSHCSCDLNDLDVTAVHIGFRIYCDSCFYVHTYAGQQAHQDYVRRKEDEYLRTQLMQLLKQWGIPEREKDAHEQKIEQLINKHNKDHQ